MGTFATAQLHFEFLINVYLPLCFYLGGLFIIFGYGYSHKSYLFVSTYGYGDCSLGFIESS